MVKQSNKIITKIDTTREIQETCSNCGCKTKYVYDLFGDGLILYCEECYIAWLSEQKGLI